MTSHVDPARDRGGERIADLRVTEVADPQPDFGSRRVDRPDDRGPASLRLDEERRGLIQRTSPGNGTHFGCRNGRHIGREELTHFKRLEGQAGIRPCSDAHVPPWNQPPTERPPFGGIPSAAAELVSLTLPGPRG